LEREEFFRLKKIQGKKERDLKAKEAEAAAEGGPPVLQKESVSSKNMLASEDNDIVF